MDPLKFVSNLDPLNVQIDVRTGTPLCQGLCDLNLIETKLEQN